MTTGQHLCSRHLHKTSLLDGVGLVGKASTAKGTVLGKKVSINERYTVAQIRPSGGAGCLLPELTRSEPFCFATKKVDGLKNRCAENGICEKGGLGSAMVQKTDPPRRHKEWATKFGKSSRDFKFGLKSAPMLNLLIS